jgi:hypothetical protein
MAIRDLKEGVKNKTAASRQELADLFRTQVRERLNSPLRIAITAVVLGVTVVTTAMGIQSFIDSRAARGDLAGAKKELKETKAALKSAEERLDRLEERLGQTGAGTLKLQFENFTRQRETPPPSDPEKRPPSYLKLLP